ncbi:hypothetical protein KO353_04330 [Elioraea tepida]|uniref:Uncharacterized protein n=1 Tax=Elioraea tepida TaxID=2843330 RepID=A0A975U4S9_9PROT|nr:hypothetical protein [Elioraea tepida]QXM26402.1 hypothetical protein KO353_04330 [Elioraea tepida]
MMIGEMREPARRDDGRIPLRVVAPEAVAEDVPAETAVVAPAGLPVGAAAVVERLGPAPRRHAIGCPCCFAPRGALANALSRLFVRRARGEVGFFREVFVALPGEEVEEAFGDVLVSARFRIER